jgi:hypothetical protein
MSEDKKKPMLGVRVPEDTKERFDEYREERGLNKSDALRRIIETGLGEIETEQREHREEARAVTPAEQWCREKVQSWAGIAILSAVGFAFLFIIFTANHFGFTVMPDWPISLAMFAFLSVFAIFGGGALATWTALRTGFARDFGHDHAADGESEVEA